MSKPARFGGALACAALIAGFAASPALADVHWTVAGTFDDTGTLSGWFDINVYGYIQDYDLTTTAGHAEAGFEYTKADSYWSNGTFYVDAQPGYVQDLHLAFADPLNVPEASNPIVGGESGPSYECVQSYGCYVPTGGTTRYIATGAASVGGGGQQAVPEPATWALMIGGFGLAGAALRRRRSAPATA